MDALDDLRSIRDAQADLERRRAEAVVRARAERYTFKQIGDALGVSSSRADQLHKRAVRDIQDKATS